MIIHQENTPDNEIAFAISDAEYVLENMLIMNKIILGGDILTSKLVHNYDNWYYNIDRNKNRNFNVYSSVEKARKYIKEYINKNGTNFFVVFVTK